MSHLVTGYWATHHAVGVVTTCPSAGISAVARPAGVPVRAVQIMVTVARAETRALGAAYRVTLPGSRKGVSFGLFQCFPSQGSGVGVSVGFYCLYRSLISRLRTWGLSKCHTVSQTVFASNVSGWEDKEALLIMLGHIWFS